MQLVFNHTVKLLILLLLSRYVHASTLTFVDDSPPTYKDRGITVDIPVSAYYPTDTNSSLYKVLRQAQILTSQLSFMGGDGVPYEQHDWNAGSDRANLKRGIDCSRAIWYVFTRAGLAYTPENRYLSTASMYQSDSLLQHHFESCALHDLRLGDVLVYRGPDKYGRGSEVGHTVLVIDPAKQLAWGSHGWDGSGQNDTGVEVQRVVSGGQGWKYWDRRQMELKACWRYKEFKQNSSNSRKSPVSSKEVGQYPETAQQRLTDRDLQDKTRNDLWLMRNEMFARHGYRFNNLRLKNHFDRQNWYRPRQNDADFIYTQSFSALERANVEFIYQYEREMIGDQVRQEPLPVHQTGVGKYPETASRRLDDADLKSKSRSELRLMRNEIYARHGYIFGVNDLQRYFEQQSWYRGNTTDGEAVYMKRFSEIERDNVDLIKKYE